MRIKPINKTFTQRQQIMKKGILVEEMKEIPREVQIEELVDKINEIIEQVNVLKDMVLK